LGSPRRQFTGRDAGLAVVVMMADESDDCCDVVRYWKKLNGGYDCVFWSCFIKGSNVIDYPWLKLRLNRMANVFIRILFHISLNDTTNAFKSLPEDCLGRLPSVSHTGISLSLAALMWSIVPVLSIMQTNDAAPMASTVPAQVQ
jgi:dolichol-phosphate mannosyltransferase